jgi:hypothetical protein
MDGFPYPKKNCALNARKFVQRAALTAPLFLPDPPVKASQGRS